MSQQPKPILKKSKSNIELENKSISIEEGVGVAASPQQVIVVLDRESKESKSNSNSNDHRRERDDNREDCCSKYISFFEYFFKFSVSLAFGITLLVLQSEESCTGTPGIITYLQGMGVLCIVYSVYQLMDYFYFRKHESQSSGRCFKYTTNITLFAGAVLSCYGLVEFIEQSYNNSNISFSANDSTNGAGCDGQCQEKYSCSDNLFFTTLFMVGIGIIYLLLVICRAKNCFTGQAPVESFTGVRQT